MVLCQRGGKVMTERDFFRWILRAALVILMIGGCCESFYFLGEIERNTNYQSYQENNNF